MLPFGKQQDIFWGFLFDDKSRRPAGKSAGTLFIEGVSDPQLREEAGKHISASMQS
jgi:hypothetical protein